MKQINNDILFLSQITWNVVKDSSEKLVFSFLFNVLIDVIKKTKMLLTLISGHRDVVCACDYEREDIV